LLLGQARLLDDDKVVDTYYKSLKKEYSYLKHKYQLNQPYKTPEFFRLRPSNFPTIRLAQLSTIYSTNNNLFHLLIEKDQPNISKIFNLGTSEFWETHYNFGKTSKKSVKKISNSFLDLLMINTIIPLKFCYQRYQGKENNESLLEMMMSIKKEDNSIVDNFRKLNVSIKDAKESQSYIQLYNEYCVKDKCLECAIGASLINIKV
jgi:hypothetical protein